MEKSWPEIQPITESLVKSGVPYKDALRRGYFAINPEAAAAEKDRVTREGANVLGTFSTAPTHSTTAAQIKDAPKITEGEKHMAKIFGKTEEEYGSMMERHRGHLKSTGFYDID